MHLRKAMKAILSLLIVSLLLAQPASADSAPDNRLDSLVGTWKNSRPGAESLKVVIRKSQAGDLVVQGDDSASSYTLTCRPESGSVVCAGSGKMRADGQAFIYRNNIKAVGDKLIESWRVNLMSSPDDSPVNSGNDELVREKDSGLDSLVGTWKSPRSGAESLKVVIRRNQAGDFVVQGDDRASSYTLTCRPESGGVSCAGSGTMRADGQAFIYRNTIKPVGDKLIESWRVNLTSSPDDSPANSGNDELVRETGFRPERDEREQRNQGAAGTAQSKQDEDQQKLVAERERREAEERLRRDAVRVAEEHRKAREETARGPEWADADNGEQISWADAKAYCESKGSGWRLPTVAELQHGNKTGQPTPCGQYTCKFASKSRLTTWEFWSNEPNGDSQAWIVDIFRDGHRFSFGASTSIFADNHLRMARIRALCVRSP
jgi:hypothetical protein